MPIEKSLRPPLASARVAILHDWLLSFRGGERILEALCELFPQAEIFTLFHDRAKVSPAIARHRIHASLLNRFPGRARYYRYLLPLFPLAIEKFDLTAFDLVISSSHCVAKGGIVAPHALHVCYCHTPMRYAWDRYGDYFGEGMKQALIFPFIHYLRMWDVTSSARVDHFIANSSWVAARVHKYYRRDATVLHPFAELDLFHPQREEKQEGYYLIVSAFAPYKRIDLAIRACNELGRPLHIVGEGQNAAALKRLAGPMTRFLGRLPADQLPKVYAGARALLFPGEEDFGISPLEAMACGTPVIAYGRGGVTDSVIDGETGLFFREQTVEGLRAAIEAFEKRERDFDPERCRKRVEDFGPAEFKRRFREIIERLWVGEERE